MGVGRNLDSDEEEGRVLCLDKFREGEGVFGLGLGWMQATGRVQALEGSTSRGRPVFQLFVSRAVFHRTRPQFVLFLMGLGFGISASAITPEPGPLRELRTLTIVPPARTGGTPPVRASTRSQPYGPKSEEENQIPTRLWSTCKRTDTVMPGCW